jgi:hypothetical protein
MISRGEECLKAGIAAQLISEVSVSWKTGKRAKYGDINNLVLLYASIWAVPVLLKYQSSSMARLVCICATLIFNVLTYYLCFVPLPYISCSLVPYRRFQILVAVFRKLDWYSVRSPPMLCFSSRYLSRSNMFDIPALQKVPCCVKELVDYNIKPTSNSLHFVYELIVGYDSSGY